MHFSFFKKKRTCFTTNHNVWSLHSGSLLSFNHTECLPSRISDAANASDNVKLNVLLHECKTTISLRDCDRFSHRHRLPTWISRHFEKYAFYKSALSTIIGRNYAQVTEDEIAISSIASITVLRHDFHPFAKLFLRHRFDLSIRTISWRSFKTFLKSNKNKLLKKRKNKIFYMTKTSKPKRNAHKHSSKQPTPR